MIIFALLPNVGNAFFDKLVDDKRRTTNNGKPQAYFETLLSGSLAKMYRAGNAMIWALLYKFNLRLHLSIKNIRM